MYRVTEVFDSIQGEGAQAGQRMVFVRLAGCNLWNGRENGRLSGTGACAAWCDTDFLPRRTMTADTLLAEMNSLWPGGQERWCCITGGEPLLQLNHELCSLLASEGWHIAVETNGTLDHRLSLDHVTVSPKKGAPLKLKSADALKVVIPGGNNGWSDLELNDLAKQYDSSQLFVQPQHGATAALENCLLFIKNNPKWRLSLQTHKLIGVR